MQNPEQPNPQQNPYQSESQTQQPQYDVPPKTDGFAITSMVLGIIAVLTCYFGIILGTVAVVFGHLSLGKMKRDPKLGGKGMAIAGLATGYVAIAVSIVSGVMLLFAVNTADGLGKEFSEAIEQSIEQERIKAEKMETRELIPDQE